VPGKDLSSRSLVGVVFIVAFVTFAGTVWYEYVWDDPYLIGRVQRSLANGDISQLFTTSFYVKNLGSARYYRPVMLATLLGEISLTGGAPWFSHLINVLIHAFNSILVYLLLRKTLRHDLGALAGALLFAVHPVHAEAVTAVFNRMDLLALTLLLPVAILWTPLGADPAPVSPLVRVSAMVSFFLACLTKETAFMLPVVFFGWEILRRKRPDRNSATNLLYVATVSFAVLLLRWLVFAREGGSGATGAIKAGVFLPAAAFPRVMKTLLVNMRLAILPFPFRSYWAGSDLTIEWTTILAAVSFLLLVVWAVRRCPRSAGVGLLWWSIFTLPVLGFFNIGQVVAAERYAYIPSVGLVMIVGGLVASLPGEVLSRSLVKYLALAGIMVLGTGAALHTRQLKNEIILFQKVTTTNPNFATIHLNLGAALVREGRLEEALLSYEKAAALVPGWTDVAFNRGNLFYRMGKYEEALKDYQSVLKNDPGDWEAELNLGNVYAALGRIEEAAGSYRRAGDINGSSGKPLVGLGVLAARNGKFIQAVSLFTDATKAEPGLTEAYEGLGESYIALGMQDMVEGAFLKALETSPGNTRAAMKLGRFLVGTGRPVQAVHAFQAALAADPYLFEAWVGLVHSLDAVGEKAKADDLIQKLGRDDPQLAGRVIDFRKRGSSLPAGK
jgi:tetratricopeptide (TPR) repeat protein